MGKGAKHYGKQPNQHYDTRPVIHVDYCFIQSEQNGLHITVLTVVDVATGMTLAAVVESKGVNDYAVNELLRFTQEVGRGGGVLQPGTVQSDQEAAIRALLRVVANKAGMSLRHSPVYVNKAHASVERWHGTLWQHCRTFKGSIKESYDIDIDVTTPLMCWNVKHTSWVHNRFRLHDDGKTSYERRWGTACCKPLCEFAESILLQYAFVPDRPKTTTTWDFGIWLGRCWWTSSWCGHLGWNGNGSGR